MRISIVTGFFLPVPPLQGGSTEKIWHRLAGLFAAAGHDVTFVSRAWPGLPSRETMQGVRHVRIAGMDHSRSLLRNLWHDLRWGGRVARALPPADVTICNTITLPVWLRRFRPSAGRVAAVIARMPKGHGRFYGRVDLLLSLSEPVTAALLRENPRLAGRIVPFPYPIDWTRLSRGRPAPVPVAAADRPVAISYIGRIHPEKGLDLLFRAASHLTNRSDLPEWRLDLTGPHEVAQGGGGPGYRAQLIAEFGGELGNRLRFLGPEFDAEELARRYQASEIFCYPSVAEAGETFGVAVAEAMAAGNAPVVSALSCFHALIVPEQTGLVFNHAAPDAGLRLADSLARLLRDAGWRSTLARRAQAHVRQFDYSAVANELLDRLGGLAAPGSGLARPAPQIGVV